MSAIASTSGRLHSEFVRLLFLQSHRETDRFFSDRRKGPWGGSSTSPIARRHDWFSVIFYSSSGKEKYFMENVFSKDMIQDNFSSSASGT